jgi:hypothetical protein
MPRFLLFGTLLFLPVSAFAQQATSSPMEQALSVKLSNEVSMGLQCTASAITLQQNLQKAQERIKALEEKYEPKSDEKK